MANDFIKQAPGGELVTPAGTEAIPVTSVADQDFWIQILNLVTRKLRETNGPTVLSMGGVADGDFLRRIGTTVIGSTIAGPAGFGQNYQIVPSVATNNLTVAMKGMDGNDPSSTNRLRFRVGNTEYEVTAAVSYVKTAGTNWHNAGSAELAGKPIDFFMYAIGETGASAGLKFGHSRIPYARTMGDFVNTTTSEKYIAGNWTNFNSTDAVVLIGRFRAQLSASAAFNWSIATSVVVNYPLDKSDWLDWTPTHSRDGTNYTTAPTTQQARYYLRGRSCFYEEYHTQAATPGGTGNQRFTLPFTINQRSVGGASNLNTFVAFWVFQENTLSLVTIYKFDGTAEATANQVYAAAGNFSYG